MNFFGAIPPVALDQVQYDTGLHKRDVCNDAFPGRYSQTCAPSNTLCCIIPDESRPACVTILGFGFCCTEHTDCFVDTESACGSSGAQECATDLCCPSQTNCVSDFNYTSDHLVRCNVNRNLIPGYTASSSSSSTSTSSSSTSTSSSDSSTTISTTESTSSIATSATVTSAVPTSTNTGTADSGLSGGATAGIVIGALAGLAILGAGAWFLWRRHRNAKEAAPVPGPAYHNLYPQNPQAPYPQTQYPQELPENEHQMYEAPTAAGYYNPHQYQKDTYSHAEMPAHQQRQELP